MASVRGYVINLPEASTRRQRLGQQLQRLGISNHYRLFAAQRGASTPAERRGLSIGEDGLWRSVLALLKAAPLDGADYLHILEDDAELTERFWRWIQKLSTSAPAHQIWFTDMYAGASVYAGLYAVARQARAQDGQAWLGGKHYTGCTSSWLIHRDHIAAVRGQLQNAYDAATERIPIDNLLRRLLQADQLTAQVSLPFLTSIQLENQLESSIQTAESGSVQATRLFGSILRRRLSHAQSAADLTQLGPLLAQLLPDEQLNAWMAERVISDLQQRKAFRYRYDARLLQEAGNPQAAG